MFDAIVAGARCAGSTLSMLLARKGYRVLLVDKARFPSDTVSTHLIWQAGLVRARQWGLLEPILRLGAPLVRACRLDIGEFEFSGSPPPLDGIDYAVAPRRILLDQVLLDAALEAGPEVRQDFYVSGIVAENGRVAGIRGRSSGGGEVTEQARIVIGADGTHSLVASAVRAPKYNTRPSTATAYYSYWHNGPPMIDFETYFREGWGAGAIPTNGGLTCIVGGWTPSFCGPDAPPEQPYRKVMEGIPRLTEFLAGAEQVEPLTGMKELPGFFRQRWGDGWALAGDAAYHKHPLSAQGITDAFRDAELLSEAIDDGFSGRRPIAAALADYQRQRDAEVMPMYDSTCDRALLGPLPPDLKALFRALRDNQREADRFFGTDAGTVPIPEFFAPENLRRIVGSMPAASAS